MISSFLVEKIWKPWCRFWFETDARAQVAVFRPALALLLLFFSISKTPDLHLFYSNAGIMSQSTLAAIPGDQYRHSLFNLVHSDGGMLAIQLVFLASLLFLALNFYPRLMAVIAYVIHLSFLNRDMAVAYGADTVSIFFLFYLCFADFRAPSLPLKKDFRSMLGSVAFRLSQIQVCIIYAYSGLDKARGMAWWGGNAMWYVLGNSQLAHINFDWISHFPLLIALLTYSTLFWEIYFPALVWVKKARYPILLFGIGLHIGIAVIMGLKSFGMLMILLYSLFLRPADAEKIAQCVKKVAIPRKVFRRESDQLIV